MRLVNSRTRVFRQTIIVCLVLAMIFGISGLFRPTRDGAPLSLTSPIAGTMVAARVDQTIENKPTQGTRTPGPVEPPSAAPSAVLPGHEGHGDGCAQCLAERKLAAYREDFARLHFSRIQEEFELDEARSGEVLDACRLFARSVLTEWSFSDSKPRLPEDAALEARRRQMLGPTLANLPPKAGENF